MKDRQFKCLLCSKILPSMYPDEGKEASAHFSDIACSGISGGLVFCDTGAYSSFVYIAAGLMSYPEIYLAICDECLVNNLNRLVFGDTKR